MTKQQATEWVYDQDEQGEVDQDDLAAACVNAEAHLMVVLLATPRQLCEALLRATGKWK